MSAFRPCCLPTAIGSLPHVDPGEACATMLRFLPDIPVWPQLPNRDPLENMYAQFFLRLPGAVADGDRIVVERDACLEAGLEKLYEDYLSGATEEYALGPEAAGLAEMRRRWRALPERPRAVKGQVTGPISAGLQITDRALRPVLYDDVLADALAKYLRLVAMEQERALAEVSEQTILFLDEPYLNAIGSSFIQMRGEQVIGLLAEVLGGLHGLKGIHCCGNTDWSLVLSTPVDVLSFDAYNYAGTLALYAADVKAFLERGGVLAWGIVPTEQKVLDGENVDSLTARLSDAVALLAGKGIAPEVILPASLITPSCGLGPLSPAGAQRALALTAGVAGMVRRDLLSVRNSPS